MINEKKILEFYKEQSKFGYIESIEIFKDIEDQSLTNNLKMTLFNYPYVKGDRKLSITFLNIKDLELGELDGLFKVVFSITDISSYQIENIRYKIVENENDLLLFSCKDFKFSFI